MLITSSSNMWGRLAPLGMLAAAVTLNSRCASTKAQQEQGPLILIKPT